MNTGCERVTAPRFVDSAGGSKRWDPVLCGHSPTQPFTAILAHGTMEICDCCLIAIWEETQKSVTEALANIKNRCKPPALTAQELVQQQGQWQRP